jgi:ABC-type Zn uptake system ZnuABC Zn-binding protein ZnuA
MQRLKILPLVVILALLPALVSGCGAEPAEDGGMRVLATTTIVGDVVGRIAGEYVEVQVLLPVGSDPHSFQPAPQDLAAIEKADLVFINGFGLEEFFGDLLEDTVDPSKIVEVSEGVSPLYFGESAEEHQAHEEEGHIHEGIDPHVWMSPLNVMVWTENIAEALAELDPAHAADFQANAQAYQAELADLHQWALEQFSSIPQDQRLLVSDHETSNYLADAYGLQVVGTLTGFSSLAESSAQELAALEDAINQLGVRAIFVSTTVPPGLAERVAEDTGVEVVRVYTGSLSEAGGPAATYLDLMRDTISQMVEALR